MECPICYDAIELNKCNQETPNKCVVSLNCGHNYCMDCLFKSMQNNNQCPMCRFTLYSEEDTAQNDYNTVSIEADEEDDDNISILSDTSNDYASEIYNEFDFNIKKQLQGRILTNLPKITIEIFHEYLEKQGYSALDILSGLFSGLTSNNLEKYNSIRQNNNMCVRMENELTDLENQNCETYFMGLEDVSSY